MRERGGWFPGIREDFMRFGITAGLAFSFGLISFLRRERLSWIAGLPCFLGGLVLLPFAFTWFVNIGGAALRPMLKVPDLSVGILMVLIGVFFLAWLLPRARARLARKQEANGNGEKEALMKTKEMKLLGIAALLAGVAFVLIYAFGLL